MVRTLSIILLFTGLISLLCSLGFIVVYIVQRNFLAIIKTIIIEFFLFIFTMGTFFRLALGDMNNPILETDDVYEALNWVLFVDRFYIGLIIISITILMAIFWKDKKGYFNWEKIF